MKNSVWGQRWKMKITVIQREIQQQLQGKVGNLI